jgi:regulation of enolase protein 1 (concanavalin A-like superfamily)
MSRSLVVGLLLTPVLAAAPVPKDDDIGRMRRLYGSTHDPDEGTEFKPSGAALQISVPQKRRLMGAWRQVYNAPRVWRDVKGDFTATVRVSFPVRSEVPDLLPSEYDRHAGGGLVVWSTDENFLTVTRDEWPHDNKPAVQFRSETRIAGRARSDTESSALDRSGYLRVQRKGAELEGSYSTDGKKWTLIHSYVGDWKDALKVGVVAENNFKAPFEIVFDEYAIAVAKE